MTPRDIEINSREKEIQRLLFETLKLSWGRTSTHTGSKSGDFINIEIGLPDHFARFRATPFYPRQYSIVHFTKSIETALSIVGSKKLRLYNLYGKNDKKEYVYASRILGDFCKPTDSYFFNLSWEEETIKKNTFVLSATRTNKIVEFWNKEYSDFGKGIGVQISFANDMMFWKGFYLNEVNYGDTRRFEQLRDGLLKIQKNHPNVNYKVKLNQIIPFFKDNIWSDEEEIRLITFYPEDYSLQVFRDAGDANWRCINLPILSKEFNKNTFSYKTIPFIRIDKIHVGPYTDPRMICKLRVIIKENYQNQIEIITYPQK